MIKKVFEWTKNNKFATLVIFALLVGYVVRGGGLRYGTNYATSPANEARYDSVSMALPQATGGGFMAKIGGIRPTPYNDAAPNLEITDRKVVRTGTISLQVKNVSSTINDVKRETTAIGGYIVNVAINRPEFGEDATVSVRIPSDKIDEFLVFAREKAVKVVSENVTGADITDQYIDTTTRLTQLEEEKLMLKNILTAARNVEEIMQVRPYISQVQNEIDVLKGQVTYMDATSKTSLVTMYLATDELSLPYQPENAWRPAAIYKSALRSLMGTVQQMGTGAIWLGVYSVLIVPAFAVGLVIYLILKRKQQ